jgi:Phosphodiester glycosidase
VVAGGGLDRTFVRLGSCAVAVGLGVALLGTGPAAAGPSGARPTLQSSPGGIAPALPGGARWHQATYRVQGVSPVLLTTLASNGSTAYAAWIDHTRTVLALYPGTREPPSASPRGLGEVPFGERWRLLATFNGGFKYAAGAGGFIVNGRVYEPVTRGFGTLVEYRNGSLAILNWRGRTPTGALTLARQNLPPLVWAGRPTARVSDSPLWGTTLAGTAVWRTAVGITRRGDLVYAAANGQTPASLANLMVRLGADRAIELDINPEWPTFITYGRRGGRDPNQFVPNPQESAYRYLSPDSRDFFATYTRAGGNHNVPFR